MTILSLINVISTGLVLKFIRSDHLLKKLTRKHLAETYYWQQGSEAILKDDLITKIQVLLEVERMSRHRNWAVECKVYIGNLGNNASKYDLATPSPSTDP